MKLKSTEYILGKPYKTETTKKNKENYKITEYITGKPYKTETAKITQTYDELRKQKKSRLNHKNQRNGRP